MESRYKRGCVSRENDACVLYSMLCHFKSNDDTLAVYPLKDELISMIVYNSDYSNVYVWNARKNSLEERED